MNERRHQEAEFLASEIRRVLEEDEQETDTISNQRPLLIRIARWLDAAQPARVWVGTRQTHPVEVRREPPDIAVPQTETMRYEEDQERRPTYWYLMVVK